MARTLRRIRRSSRRVRRNPPKMTPALKKKIGARIRALHRAGKYRRSRPARTSRRRRSAARSVRPIMITRRRSSRRRSSRRVSRRRSSRRRSSFRRVARFGAVGGGLFGLKSILSMDNLKMAGGALAGTFVANFANRMIAPRLGGLGSNPFVQAAIKLGSTAVAAKFVSRYSRPVAQGMLLGGLLVVVNDLMRNSGLSVPTGGVSQYLGRGMSQYLGAGARPMVGQNIQSLVGPVTPSAKTFGRQSGRVGAIYGNSSAFKSDAWNR